MTLQLLWNLQLHTAEPAGYCPAVSSDSDACDFQDFHEDVSALEHIPPGFSRGLQFTSHSSTTAATTADKKLFHVQFSVTEAMAADSSIASHNKDSAAVTSDEEIKNDLTQFKSIKNLQRASEKSQSRLSFARPVDLNHLPDDFEQRIPQLAHEFPFQLDVFQKQAIYHLERGESVFVAAHTSAGKTAVAEYAIALSQKHMTKTIYTSPIKALSNQKFRDFHETFESVGLLTGDVQLNADASCLIMTTEILRSMLYRGANLIQDVEFVIFDEVHYINDQERGVVWEEVIIMLPPHVTLIMLSATTPNTLEFADWVGRTRGREIFVISTHKRPVPLEHFLFTNRLVTSNASAGPGKPTAAKELYRIVDENRKFSEANYRAALQSVSSSASNKGEGPRHTGQDKSLWRDVVYFLERKKLLPAVAFIFSKRRCDENADALGSMDLNSSSERSAVHTFLERSLRRLQPDDAQLPQIVWLRDLLSRGIAVHHSGLLPLMKEVVEMLFSRGFVKVLFATETFAMGVNMPARTVLFSALRKHDGTALRPLLPGEYVQMAGRAGRRGLDPTGTVITLCPDGSVPNEAQLRQVLLGEPTRLVSQFRLTYQMILSLLRVESLKIEEMLKRSFSEAHAQRSAPLQEAQMEEHEAALDQLIAIDCAICEGGHEGNSLEQFYTMARSIYNHTEQIFSHLATRLPPKVTSKAFAPGNIVVVDANESIRAIPAVILRFEPTELLLGTPDAFFCPEEPVLVYPPGRVRLLPISQVNRSTCIKTFTVPPKQLIRITELKIPAPTLPSQQHQVPLRESEAILAEFAALLQEHTEADFVREAPFPQFSSMAGGFEIDELVIIRRHLLNQLTGPSSSFTAARCPSLLQHYTALHQRKQLIDHLAVLQFQLSDASLHLLPEYHSRLRLLQSLHYIDPAHTVQIKGRVACEINTVDPLILTELLFENVFGAAEAGEIAAILAGLVFQERSSLKTSTCHFENDETTEGFLQRLLLDDENDIQTQDEEETDSKLEMSRDKNYLINVTPHINHTCRRIVQLARELAVQQRNAGLAHLSCSTALSNLLSVFNPALVRTVYEWSRGTSFLTLTTQITTIPEGSIVRCITRLDETLRELAGAGKIMGDPVIVQKAEEAIRLIRRDICFASSLYME